MAKFNLNDYETVEERLKKFWKDNPKGRINTDVVSTGTDGTWVIVKAELFKQADDTFPVATGLAQEYKGQGGFANNEAWMENAETSAIGRACANWMYQGNKKARPSREEMSKSIKPEEPKVEPKEEEVAKTTAKSAEKFAEDIGAETSVADSLNIYIDTFSQSKDVKDSAKKTAYQQTVEQGADSDVNEWSEDEQEMFYGFFEVAINSKVTEEDIVEVFGEVKDVSSKLKLCPQCNKSEHIQDNREKKASDDKFQNIPDFTCSNYNADGCGWGGYIGSKGDRAVPSTWL